MQSKFIPTTVTEFLAAHGGSRLIEDGLSDMAALVSVFRDAAPDPDSDSLSQENLTWLTAIADCLGVMDERLYEHYRALIDLFRAGIFRTERKKLLAYPSWNGVREKGVQLGILPADLYGQQLPRPHLGQSDVYLSMKGGTRA